MNKNKMAAVRFYKVLLIIVAILFMINYFELFCLQISTKTNSILALVVSERIVNSAAPRLLSAHRPLELVYYLLIRKVCVIVFELFFHV